MDKTPAPSLPWLPRLAFMGLGMTMALVAGAVFP